MQDTIGKIIKTLREHKQLTLKAAATALEIDFSMLAKIEKGQRTVNNSLFGRLAILYEVDEKTLRICSLAEQVFNDVHEYEFAEDALKIVINKIKEKNK